FGLTIARRGASEELGERLERYGSRDYVATEAEGLSRRAPGRLAQAVEHAVAERSFTGNIRIRLARADLLLTAGEWLIMRLVIAILAGAIGVLLGGLGGLSILSGLIGAVIGFFASDIYISLRIRRRVKAFVNQLGDTITLMSNSLRAGYSLLQ